MRATRDRRVGRGRRVPGQRPRHGERDRHGDGGGPQAEQEAPGRSRSEAQGRHEQRDEGDEEEGAHRVDGVEGPGMGVEGARVGPERTERLAAGIDALHDHAPHRGRGEQARTDAEEATGPG